MAGLLSQKPKIRISSSIGNFRDKLLKRFEWEEYKFPLDIFKPCLFVGLYHYKDWLRFILHRGQKKVFWCGSDLVALRKRPVWRFLITHSKHIDYVENSVERVQLLIWGRRSKITPMIFDDPNKYQISFQPSDNPRVFASYHKGRENEYAYIKHPQIDYFDGYTEEQFNNKIKDYQGAIRFNKFDGFAETLAKSLLMGQYPASYIKYPYVYKFDDLQTIDEIPAYLWYLKKQKQPNYEARKYWLKVFEDSLYQLKEVW